jgi:hypothetical protein
MILKTSISFTVKKDEIVKTVCPRRPVSFV